MNRIDLKRRVGNVEQLAYVRECTFSSGKAKGVRVLEVNNGLLNFTILCDRGFDISDMRYQNTNLSFISKNGVVNPHLIHTNAVGFTSSFTGGFLYTCGLDNTGGDKNGKVTHGSQTTVPTSVVNIDKYWDGNDYVLQVTGIMENTALFGPNVIIERTITTSYMSDEINIRDEIINEGFLNAQYRLLYHFNFGYPLVDEGAEIIADIISTVPRTPESAENMEDMLKIDEPKDEYPEFVFFHKLRGDNPTVELRNEKLGLSAKLTYSAKNLVEFTEWKSMVSGDYAVGLEPASVNIDSNDFNTIAPQSSIVNELTFKVEKI